MSIVSSSSDPQDGNGPETNILMNQRARICLTMSL